MPDFSYQPSSGPLSGVDFERQTTQFFQQVSAAAGAASTAASTAQTTANEALERSAASNLVDGKTTRADAGGTITAKDVAIGGNLEDLVSARGIFDTLTKGSVDCNTLTEQGVYAISLAGTVNGPGFSAKLVVFNGKGSVFTNQMAIASGAGTSGAIRVAYRSKNNGNVWSPWSEGILSGRVGDGITVNNGIISVPEYEGATASTTGTSGLVPPAAAGQQESFLTGGGEYKPVKSMPSGAVIPFAKVNLGGPDNRTPIFWGQSEPDTGWLICDGGSDGRGGSVPDLREEFIMGANGVDDAGQTGGASKVTPSITVAKASTGVKTQGTTLTVSTTANHPHRLNLQQYKFGDGGIGNYGFDSSLPTVTPLGDRIENTGGSASHVHGVTDPTHTHTAKASELSITPPFYKLVYCIKLPES